jgi:hypothetical protein
MMRRDPPHGKGKAETPSAPSDRAPLIGFAALNTKFACLGPPLAITVDAAFGIHRLEPHGETPQPPEVA